jgi:hypothetical protein
MHQARPVPAGTAACPVKPVSDGDRVHITVIAVERQHRSHPHRDRLLSKSPWQIGAGQRCHPGRVPVRSGATYGVNTGSVT